MKKKFDLKLKINKFGAEKLSDKMAKKIKGGGAALFVTDTYPPGCDHLSGEPYSTKCYSVYFCG